MELSKAEQVILGRFKERAHRAGSIQPGLGMRAKAIRYIAPQHPGVDFDQGLQGMVEKGWLKPNAAGTWYFLTAEGVEQVQSLPNAH